MNIVSFYTMYSWLRVDNCDFRIRRQCLDELIFMFTESIVMVNKTNKTADTNLKFVFSDKDKKRKKQMQRKVPEMPKIIENPAGVTSITLPELQLLLDEIEEMKGDKEYDGLTGFLSQLLQKVQNWDSGNYTRTEIELFVRQFQDFNEGFHYRMDQKPRGKKLASSNRTKTFCGLKGENVSK